MHRAMRVAAPPLRRRPACVLPHRMATSWCAMAMPVATASLRWKGCLGSCAAPPAASASSGKPKVTHYSKLGMDGFTDAKYNTAADDLLERIENIVDALDSVEVEDINCNGGVLTLETAKHGTFIINKQAPNVQLWLSSPVSGPHHYDMDVKEDGSGGEVTVWVSDHDGHNLCEKLEKELADILGTPIKL